MPTALPALSRYPRTRRNRPKGAAAPLSGHLLRQEEERAPSDEDLNRRRLEEGDPEERDQGRSVFTLLAHRIVPDLQEAIPRHRVLVYARLTDQGPNVMEHPVGMVRRRIGKCHPASGDRSIGSPDNTHGHGRVIRRLRRRKTISHGRLQPR